MSYNTVLDVIAGRLVEQRNTIKDRVVRSILPQEEYARLCGVVQGLDFAEALIKDLAIKLENDDE